LTDLRNWYNIFNRKTEGKRQLDRYRSIWENNTKTNVKEIEHEDGELHSSASGFKPMCGSGNINSGNFDFMN
jgi:hypothetical protein